MKNIYYLLLMALGLLACTNSTRKQNNESDSVPLINSSLPEDDSLFLELVSKPIDTASFAYQLRPKGNYNQIKSEIRVEKARLSRLYLSKKDSAWQKLILDSARNYLTNSLLNMIIPHWYGMPWSFSGYSAIPQKGEVGCSYFVSNTLLHAGFNVSRYKLAQQGPRNEAKSIDTNFVTYVNEEILSGDEINKLIVDRIVQENKDGLYFVGLSSHVGYLLIHEGELYYIHSNYGKLAVMLEFAVSSQEFIDSQYFIASITHNDELIRKWLLNTEVKVFLDKNSM